jgi:hypothetical protein
MSALHPLDGHSGLVECLVRCDGVDRVEVRRCRISAYIDHRHVFWPEFDYETEMVVFNRRGDDNRPHVYRNFLKPLPEQSA